MPEPGPCDDPAADEDALSALEPPAQLHAFGQSAAVVQVSWLGEHWPVVVTVQLAPAPIDGAEELLVELAALTPDAELLTTATHGSQPPGH